MTPIPTESAVAFANRLDIPAARKASLAYIAEQGLTRFLTGHGV